MARTTRRVPGILAPLLHDFAITPDFYVLYQSPLKFNALKFASEYATGATSLAGCVEHVQGQPGRLHLVPRPGGRAAGAC